MGEKKSIFSSIPYGATRNSFSRNGSIVMLFIMALDVGEGWEKT
jgi:hypothetical protein